MQIGPCRHSFKLRRLESTDQCGISAHLLLTGIVWGLSFTHPILSSSPAPSSFSNSFRHHRVLASPVAVLWVCLTNLKAFFFFSFPFLVVPFPSCLVFHQAGTDLLFVH